MAFPRVHVSVLGVEQEVTMGINFIKKNFPAPGRDFLAPIDHS